MNDRLLSAIKEMHMVDQNLRKMASSPEITLENYLVYLADQVHNARLHKLIGEYGYPTREDVGEDGLKDFWLLVQHQDGDLGLQKDCLEKCGFEPQQKAYLTDRVAVNSEEEQVYGTQLQRGTDGKLVPKPIRDAAGVDERRREAGLGPLEEYVKKSNE